MVDEPDINVHDTFLAAFCSEDDKRIRAITWDLVKKESSKDKHMLNLISLINSSFPEEKNEMPLDLLPYWSLRDNLYVIDGVVLMKDQVLIPPPLCNTDSAICTCNKYQNCYTANTSFRSYPLVALSSSGCEWYERTS